MKDDLFERLRAVDPVTDEQIAQETRALGNTPGRIVEREPSNVRRFPTAARRRATLVAVAAVVVVAIALPLTLLRPLGDGGPAPADRPGNWVAVGTLADITPQGVVYRAEIGAFLVARLGGEPLALSATIDEGGADLGQRAIYCAASDRFVFPAGDVFDADGVHVAGPGARGLDRLAVRVRDGVVEVDPTSVTPAGSAAGGDTGPQDLGCQTANGIPLEGALGFGIPNGTDLPPIAAALPQSGMRVSSPIAIVGSANVFEATVSIRVLDATGTVIAEAFTTATCGTGCRGGFSADVDFAVDQAQAGTVLVFESSAMDGSMINTVEIPVTLTPGIEGPWYDDQDVPLPDGSPGATGTVLVVFPGAEHCQWGSASFMHLGWPVGTVANELDQWRQYVRDPKGLFDDGALHVGYLADASLPADATDTGFHRGPWHLYVSPSEADDAIYVVDEDTGVAERWGRSSDLILCN